MRLQNKIPKPAGGWRRTCNGLLIASLAFACGAGLAYTLRQAPRKKPAAATQQAAPTSTPCVADVKTAAENYDDEFRAPELLEWENKHNGTALSLNYDEATLKWGLEQGKVVVLPWGRTLASAGNTLYMLDESGRRIIWSYAAYQMVFDFAYVGATGLVYGTAGDNTMFILDAATGRQLYIRSRNGRAGYGAVLPYGDDSCLVMDAFAGYRAGPFYGEPMQDGVTAWRRTKMLWHLDVPPDAVLQVVGGKIYAVTKTKNRMLVRELKVPTGAR